MRTENYEEEENVVLKTKIDNIIQNVDKKNLIIENFLVYLLVCLYNIEDLKEFCKNILIDKNKVTNEQNGQKE